MIPTYHIHIYFALDEINLVCQVQVNIAHALPQITYVGEIPVLIEPHPMPIFEIRIPASDNDQTWKLLNLASPNFFEKEAALANIIPICIR